LNAKRITKKLTQIAAYTLGALIVLLVAFHFWFVHHAKQLIEDLVSSQSKGKLSLEIDKFNFNWFNRKMELKQAVFYSTDTATASTAYNFRVDRIKIQVKKIFPLVFEKRFLIDSIQLIRPDITVTRLRVRDSNAVKTDTSLSIPQEMGRIYHSIQDALRVLRVDRFQIDDGTFSLINKTRPEEKPIAISNLNFYLENLQVDTSVSGVQKKILFSDNVGLQTHHQDILFPDGRHRLSFSNFRINLRNRLAEFDSCTITATKEDSANNSFQIFFDKLRMTDIDFDTLYHTEVIKADSVYCINPRFSLNVDLPKRTGPVKAPQLNELIQQLTGNMELAFVVVQNASFDITTTREGRPSSFTSDNNNFELQGLRIQEKAARPLTVERFAMAIRNYENFLRDSAYAIEFDSILINNNRISLSNFSYQELKNNKAVNNLIVPQFEMQGLSWDNLVFNQQFNAERVTMYRPVINYTIGKSKNQGQASKDIVNALADISRIIQLNHLDIVNGQVNLFFANNTVLHLEGATMSVAAKQLVDSRKLTELQRSIGNLHFTKGLFKTGSMSAWLEDVQFRGANNGLEAGTVRIEDKNAFTADIKDVSFRSMVIDDRIPQLTVHGISWKQADVRLLSFMNKSSSSGSVKLYNIKGANTKVTGADGDKKLSVFLQNISAREFLLSKGQPLQLTALVANGNDLNVSDKTRKLTVGSIDIADQQSSLLKDVLYRNYSDRDSISIDVPSISFVPDISSIIKGNILADRIKVTQPAVRINLTADPNSAKTSLQAIAIGSLLIQQPDLQFVSTNERGTTTLKWNGKETDNSFEIKDLKVNNETSSIAASQLRLSMDHFLYTDVKGKTFNAGNGQLTAQINQLAMHKNETDNWDWQGIIANLTARDFEVDSLGKKGGKLIIAFAKLNDLSVNSAHLLSLRELVRHNTRFNLQEVTGSYQNTKDHYQWSNAEYDRRRKYFSLDSFTYRPAQSRDAFVKQLKYQDDYIIVKTGKVTVGPFDIQRYITDSILDLGVMNIKGGYMFDHRDKRVPREPGSIRALPANLLKRISTRLLIDQVTIHDAFVDYEEVNEVTNAAGRVTIEKLNGTLTHLRNFNLAAGDSLEIKANGYLQGSIFTRLRVKEAYTDPLGGFIMTAQMSPADLTVLNPVLSPLASVHLKSGWMDTMTMRIVGREELAFGEVKMFYHDLKVRIGRPAKTNKRSPFSGLASFLANTIIKNENKKRTAPVFFVRWRDRSAINYLVKIALNGMSSSIGIGKSKRLIRKHKAEVQSKKLPPFE
jgi:hypothetical protein